MKLRDIEKEELNKILENHSLWLLDSSKGERADLRSADLQYANLQSADLQYANLQYANLQYANLHSANLHSADLQYANLQYANLRSANLRSANLQYANLRSANLRSANLQYAASFLKKLKTINGLTWDISLKDDLVEVGCQKHTYKVWCNFTNEEINKMNENASDFYPILMTILAYEYADTEWALIKE